MIVLLAGATDTSIDIQVVDDSGLPVTGLVSATFPTVKYSKGTGADATITTSDLSALTDAHSDGGVKERGEGVYRLDLPDAVSSAVAPAVKIRGEATDKRIIAPEIQVASATRGLVGTSLPAAAADAAGGLPISDAGGLDLDNRMPAAAAITNINTVYSTDFAANYDTTNDVWKVNATYMAGYSLGTTYTGNNFVTFFENALQFTAATVDNIGSILADTNELQTDWVNGGRLDLILDARASQTSVDTIDGNIDLILADTGTDGVVLTAAAMQALIEQCFTYNATANYAGATAGSLVKEIADNAGGSALTASAIADEVQTRTIAAVTTVTTTTNLTNLPTIPVNWLTASGLAADAVAEIQSGLATSTELAKVPKSDGTATWNATALASINTQCDTALNDYDGPTNTEMVAAFAEIKGATWASTDTLEAIRDRGDAAWVTATGFSTHSAADVVTAIGTGSTLTALATQASVNTIDDFIDTEIAAIKAKTDLIPTDPADQSLVEAAILAAWTTALTESYAADGSPPTPAQALMLIMQRLTEFAISGTTITVKKLDGSTTAATLTMDATADTATSSTRAT